MDAEYTALAAFGRLDEDMEGERLEVLTRLLDTLPAPVSSEEINVILNAFPATDDTCYGLCWTLLHTLEAGSGYSRAALKAAPPGPWPELLALRLSNAGL
jgi:hypothetical protein